MQVRGRLKAVLACAALAAGACSDASGEVQPLPPLERPSPEARAGLPQVTGIWRFAGFEIRPQDTLLVREQAYQMVPLAEVRIITQRLDSIAGQIVRGGVGFPFSGEVRRDSTVSIVTFSEGQPQFAAGRVLRDTFWIELTTVTEAQSWSPAARVALVRRVGGPPFRRLLGGSAINPPVDSVAIRDSIRMDSLRRAGVTVPPAGTPPGAQPPATTQPQPGVPAQPGARPTVPVTQPQTQPQQPQQQRPPAQQQRPPVQQPRPRPQNPPPTDTPPEPVDQPDPDPMPPSFPPPANAPKDTIRFGNPPLR